MTTANFLKGLSIKGQVENDPDLLSQYITNNPLVEEKTGPHCVIKPQDVNELKEILKESDSGLVVVSSGTPHIRGGSACAKPHAVVDLSGWKKIPWINNRNRVCIVEPGVTYGELTEALLPHGMTIPMPLAPRSTKSVIAATMDREPSTWPNKQWDYQDPVASTEFLFGTGHLFRSGAAGGPGSLEEQRKSKGAQKAPQGPGQSDYQRVVMGAQGSMGVVTWISLRTEFLPSVEKTFVAGDDTLKRMIPFFYVVQRPKLGEQAFILNRTAAAMLMTYGDPEKFSSVRDSLPEFVCLQNIAGFRRLPAERLAYHQEEIREKAEQNNVELKERLGAINASELLKTATSVCGPVDWRHSLKGQCLSIIFLSTLVRAPEFIEIFKKTAQKAGVDEKYIGIYIQPVVQNSACHFEFMVPFNPEDSNETAKMKSLEEVLCHTLIEAGAFFSRPYGAAVRMMFGNNPNHMQLVRLSKELFDPKNILNPGKFDIS